MRSSHDPRDPLGIPHMLTFTVTGPYNPGGSGDTPSRQRIFACRPAANATPQAEEACATRIISGAGPPRLPRAGHRRRYAAADDVLPRGAQAGRLRGRHRGRLAAHPRQPQVHLPRRARSADGEGGRGLRDHRSRAGVAAGVLPLEQRPRRSAAAGGEPGTSARARRARARRSSGCWPTRRPSGCPPTSPASGCSCATCGRSSRTRWSSPTSTTTCAAPSSTRRGCSSTASGAKIATSWT